MEAKGEAGQSPRKICIVTGLSGAGKSTVLRVFEDLGYFAVDGLPAGLAPEVAAIMSRDAMLHFPGMAIGMDMRQDDFLKEYNAALDKLGHGDLPVTVVFLDADDATLMRRYAATRRPHPLERLGLGLEGAIAREREALQPARDKADLVINSTDFSIHDLRREIQRHFLKNEPGYRSLRVNIISFGFKYGIPRDADIMFDLRFLDNPYFVEELRPLSGKDKEVAEYVFQKSDAREFKNKLTDLLLFTLSRMETEGRYRVTIALGCTGGRHRSVAMAESIAVALRQAGFAPVLEHRNLDMDPAGQTALSQ